MVFDVVIGRSKRGIEKHGKTGAVFIGKQYVEMGEVTSLSNPVYLDVASSHIVFVVGKRGGGKCLHGDTLITLGDGSQVKIKDLEKNPETIFTLDNDLKIREVIKTCFYKRSVDKLLEVKLRSGKTIKLTPEHPLFTVEGWLPAEELNIGARIATPRKVEAFGEDSLRECDVKLLAYLIAEGHLGSGFVLFSNMDEKIIDDFKVAIKEFNENLIIKTHSEGSLRIIENKPRSTKLAKRNESGKFVKGSKFEHKTSLREWLEKINLYGEGSLTKFIPEEIFKLPKHQLSLFLNRLFSCDGTIYKKAGNWFVSYCSSSNELISQVQHLLLRFGIVAKLRKKIIKNKFELNELDIYGEGANKFLQEIGFYGQKEERSAIALKESVGIIRNPNVDTVPKEIWITYRPDNWAEIGRKLNYAHPKAMRESMRYSPSRQKLLQIAEADKSDLLFKFANSDIFWDEIVSVDVLKGEFEVYDITVPETHNFIANDIVVHNSYTMGVIAEGITDLEPEVKQNLSVILLDTMGVYWTMKYPNMQDAELLKEWKMEPKSLDIKIYTPTGFYNRYKEEGIPTDFPFSIRPMDVGPEDWCKSFGLDINSAEGVLITKIVQDLIKEGESFEMDDLIGMVHDDAESDHVVKSVVTNQLEKAKGWGIFSKTGTSLKDLVVGGQVTVLDVSPYATIASGWAIKALVVGLISKRLFNQRMIARKTEEFSTIDSAMHYFTKKTEAKLEEPLVWLVLDEAHELLPKEGETAATNALITILREGRQPGISLILASQQPGKIHTDVMTQSDIVISHRLTAKVDVDALGQLMQS
jgi:intein/homing endonuclease